MKKNIVTIIFLFFVIFVALMFGQDVEQFDVIDQTDPNGPSNTNNGTYFTKEDANKVSVFSALKDFSDAISKYVNNDYRTIKDGNPTIGIKNNFENCINTVNATQDATQEERNNCYSTHYENQLKSFGSSIFISGTGKNLVDAVNRNTKAPLSNRNMDPTDIRVTNDEYETTKLHVQNTYNSNRQIQLDLDRKMNEMLTDKSGIKLESATKQNSTMYVGILWTVSAATALYYIFIKI